jgi:hypothetical protein
LPLRRRDAADEMNQISLQRLSLFLCKEPLSKVCKRGVRRGEGPPDPERVLINDIPNFCYCRCCRCVVS